MAIYSLSACSFLWGGVPATQYGEGGFVEVSPKDDTFTVHTGVGGESIRAYTGSKVFEVKLTLLQTSPYNDYISALYNADVLASDLGQGGAGVLPFGLVDLQSTTLAFSPQMFVTKPSPIKRTDKPSDCEWTFIALNTKIFVGGQVS